MTETDWAACTDPVSLLDHLRCQASPRKLRLYACGWAATWWKFMRDQRSEQAVEIAERFVDGRASLAELILAYGEAQEAYNSIPFELCPSRRQRGRHHQGVRTAKAAAAAASTAADPTWNIRIASNLARVGCATKIGLIRCAILRDIFGNPFRPFSSESVWLARNDGTVAQLASAIYDERAFDLMPILADALEDAGCHDADILEHCRGGGEHVRGCWVVDLLLGKE